MPVNNLKCLEIFKEERLKGKEKMRRSEAQCTEFYCVVNNYHFYIMLL